MRHFDNPFARSGASRPAPAAGPAAEARPRDAPVGLAAAAIAAARAAQPAWAARPVLQRLAVVETLRHRIAATADGLAAAVAAADPGRPATEALAAEVLPLADACRFLEREAARLLAPRRPGRRGRPAWLGGVDLEVRREPLGLVLVVGPSNYPLFLPGAQALQALAAGNAVLWKPGRGGLAAARALAALLAGAGLPAGLLGVLPESPDAARAAMAAAGGPDKVVVTGSAATGREVLRELAPRLVPATLELSGCDACFVLPGADLDLVARALAFGLRWNGGATCIAPRRVLVPRPLAAELEARLRLLREDLFAPVLTLVPVADVEEALAVDARCPYALGASIFGPEEAARALAARVRAGAVTINDLIVPTADPRFPFGGRGASGFGVTRGAEGLLELTAVKAVAVRRGRFRPHLEGGEHPELFLAWLAVAHGAPGGRLAALQRLLRALLASRKARAHAATARGYDSPPDGSPGAGPPEE